MSSAGVFEKKSKCLEGKKNLSVRRKIFKVWRGGKMFKYRISCVRKKWKKISERKFWVNLLSSYSLGRFFVNLQVKVFKGKKMEIFQSILHSFIFTKILPRDVQFKGI